MATSSTAGGSSGPTEVLVSEQGQLLRINDRGEAHRFGDGRGSADILGEEVFVLWGRTVVVYDTSGRELRKIPVPRKVLFALHLVVLPDRRLAFLDNQNDAIYVVGPEGEHLTTVKFNKTPDRHFQNMRGVVVGDKLIISENGHGQLISVDLQTYQTSIFLEPTARRGWLGAITYGQGEFYLCQSRRIYRFTEGAELSGMVASGQTEVLSFLEVYGYPASLWKSPGVTSP